MENHIQNIESINNYLNKTLSETEVIDFEIRLENDSEFKDLYENHIVFLEGLKRQSLKGEIIKGKQRYIRNKWFRYLGILIAVLVIPIVIYSSLKTSNVEETDVQPEENTNIVLDTIFPKNDLHEEIIIDTSKATIETAVDEVASKKDITKVEIPKKAAQKFTIDTSKDITLTCKEGTKLVIKANSFSDQNNKNVTGNVDLEVTEYYKVSDILFANLTTKSDDKLLETGGMLFIKAKKDNLDLKLKENTSIEMSFPTANKKEGMQLFSGVWKNDEINWQLQNELIEKVVTPIEEDVEVPFAVIEQVPIYPGCENLTNSEAKKCTTEAISKYVQSNFNTEIAKNLGLTGRQRINVIFRINQNGNVIDVRSRASDPDLEDEANRVITSLPKMQPGKQRGRVVTVPYSLPIIFEVEGGPQLTAKVGGDLRKDKQILDSLNNKRFEDRLTGLDRKNVTASEVNRYILRTSNLGWINCDRFNSSRQRIKYKLKIKNDTDVRIDMVFKSINSVLTSYRSGNIFDFDMIPKNEDVVLIAVKKDNNKFYLDVVETTISENPNIELSFKEVTLTELKEQIKKLDKLFK
ncbi:TonB-like protein [Mariniflexile fucanivorans]|uniref:TonB-like protein n=1 Tax=Mariniflexile fucanivorans TaxID=264023 RepID=A0A4R1RRM9_9FLAO|nr:energy transducer TonB [Mariniflexile fucanivorans]TCL69098.1 TonB-like protein [Mariniflexile fucanivorans]